MLVFTILIRTSCIAGDESAVNSPDREALKQRGILILYMQIKRNHFILTDILLIFFY